MAERIPVVYCAGPFRAPNAWQRKINVHEAAALSMRIAECGAMPLCPHKNTEDFDGCLDDQFWLDGTLELLRRCNAAAFTRRWEESSGARAAYDFCKENEIPIFHEADIPRAFTHWINEWKEHMRAGQ